MSRKRLLDAIQFLDVARLVAGKHLALRQRQMNDFTRTSTLTKGVQSQTENLVITVKAAAALARRFNEGTDLFSQSNTPAQRPDSAATSKKDKSTGVIPEPLNHDATNKLEHVAYKVSGLLGKTAKLQEQTEFRITSNPAEHHLGVSESEVRKAHDVCYSPLPNVTSALSGLPQTNIHKATTTRQDIMESNTNSDVPYSSTRRPPEKISESDGLPSLSQEGLSDDTINQLFHSPRVASMMRAKERPISVGNQGTARTLPVAMNYPQNRDTSIESSKETFSSKGSHKQTQETQEFGYVLAKSMLSNKEKTFPTSLPEVKDTQYQMVESRVPSSRIGRLWQYSGLAASMAFGAVGETLRRATGNGGDKNGSLMFNAANMERLVAKLSRMRGAALKLGQMMSFQDSRMLPEPIAIVLQRVQDRADYMPASQRDKVLQDNLGSDWRDLFETFDEIPMAAASIGQVHAARLKDGRKVAVKIQYPGVADSIDSDLNNLSILLTASRILPKGLFLDKTIANARTELSWECDYIREAECGERFRQLLQDEASVFVVPRVIKECSGKQVLTMEHLEGVPVTRVKNFTQDQRDWIGTQILRLSLREICDFQFMQTDPNWTNFLYNPDSNQIELLDFGASREYPGEFIDTYVRTLVAASRNDRELCRELSQKLGYLTGFESKAMVDAHVDSILTIAEPFMESAPDVYDFNGQTITDRVRELIPIMLRERLTPPPEETYSLHRKLSGAFLLCAKLQSRVRCKDLFQVAIRRVESSA